MKKPTYGATIGACFLGYVVQAVVVNFTPLLFVFFHEYFGIDLVRVTSLITVNFGFQLLIDLFSSRIVKALGYRGTAVTAQAFATVGLIALAFLPKLLSDAYTGLLIATMLYAVGSGLDEVIISPLVENCPTKHKAASMSLLHSFYCWGQLFTILASTAFFAIFGIESYSYLCLFWALIPLSDMILFTLVPIPEAEEGEKPSGILSLTRKKRFWLFAVLMLCAGASELCISQWASAFAQMGLHVDKTVGDLAGPSLFALFMGTARIIYAKQSERIKAWQAMLASGALCVVSYLMASLSASPVVGLCGVALAGFAVGIFWPCTLSMGASGIKDGGIALFALLALFGDLGCTAGPTLAGMISTYTSLNVGILASTFFPALLILTVLLLAKDMKQAPAD